MNDELDTVLRALDVALARVAGLEETIAELHRSDFHGAAAERATIVAWIKRNPGTSPQTAWVECAEWIALQLEAGGPPENQTDDDAVLAGYLSSALREHWGTSASQVLEAIKRYRKDSTP